VTVLPAWLQPLAEAARSVRAQDVFRLVPPDDGTGRESAVLIALTDTAEGPGVLLIERAATLRNHAGQVAFPGGAADPGDPHRVATALREAEEEVGLDPSSVHVFAELPAMFLPPSGFVVTPVLAWWPDPHPVAPVDPAEVARVEIVPVAELAEPGNRFRVQHPSGFTGPGFAVADLFVWGFTAGLLDAVLTLGGWARPWDTQRLRDLPPRVSGRVAPPPRTVE
jgi:8-oxo-dGTP pyrophosphatase MutT (NUDIX family)